MTGFGSTLVMKFGGAAVATAEKFSDIADIILNKKKDFTNIVVVVSAMGNTTDDLLLLAQKVHPNPPTRELDMLISVGERISISLLAMALFRKGIDAISFTGSQAGIITTEAHSEAHIIDVKPKRLIEQLQNGKIVIVAGFQGVSSVFEITTLGRGGSDTTAVALGVALNAEKVEFYKDVDGFFSEDPKHNPQAKFHPALSYEEALEIIKKGGQILHDRCVHLGRMNQIPLHILPFDQKSKDESGASRRGTIIGSLPRKFSEKKCYENDYSRM